MPSSRNEQPKERCRIGSRLKLSMLAAFAGWSVATSFVLLLGACAYLFGTRSQTNPLIFASIFCVVMGIFVAVAWLLLLMPLSIFVPMKSAFWQPTNLAIIGAIVGLLMMLGYALWERHGVDIHYRDASAQWNDYLSGATIFGVPAALIGGITGYVAAILNRRS